MSKISTQEHMEDHITLIVTIVSILVIVFVAGALISLNRMIAAGRGWNVRPETPDVSLMYQQ